MRQERASNPPTSQQATCDKCAHQIPILFASAFSIFIFVPVAFSLTLRAKEVHEDRTTYATTAQHPACNQGAHELLIVAFSFFASLDVPLITLTLELASGP